MFEITYPSPSKVHSIGACIYCGHVADLTDEHDAWAQGFAERAEGSGTRYVIVLIRLFAFLGAPQYIVVAGDQPVTNQKPAGKGGVSGNGPKGRFPTSIRACGDGLGVPDGEG